MIQVSNLTKTYPGGKGIFSLGFSVQDGEVFGFLGPNGAGKTTTIRALMGFIQAESGSCKIDGRDCFSQASELHQSLGYLPGEIAFFERYTALGYLKLMADFFGLKDTRRRDELIERFELDTRGMIQRMSKGMKQKLGIIAAFMHDPRYYLLDEPTSGLDPLMQNAFIDLVLEEKRRGKTIFLSSHIFDEVERTCDRVGIIRQGRLMTIEQIQQLKGALQRHYLVSVASPEDVQRIQQSGLSVTVISPLKLQISITEDYQALFSLLSQCHVTSFDAGAQGLEQMFIQYYGEEKAQ